MFNILRPRELEANRLTSGVNWASK
jgi:hypothetical protein